VLPVLRVPVGKAFEFCVVWPGCAGAGVGVPPSPLMMYPPIPPSPPPPPVGVANGSTCVEVPDAKVTEPALSTTVTSFTTVLRPGVSVKAVPLMLITLGFAASAEKVWLPMVAIGVISPAPSLPPAPVGIAGEDGGRGNVWVKVPDISVTTPLLWLIVMPSTTVLWPDVSVRDDPPSVSMLGFAPFTEMVCVPRVAIAVT
jgi:hypothetical protein